MGQIGPSDRLLRELGMEPAGEGEESPQESPDAPAGTHRYKYQVGRAIDKVRYSHDGMIDLIIEDPSIHQNDLARVFGYTPAWVSLVMSSDAFKERLEARRAELVDPAIRASLRERWEAVTKRSLEILADKLSGPASTVSDGLALRAAELGSKSLGLGGNAPPVVVADPNHLDRLAERLVQLQRRVVVQDGAVDVEARMVGDVGGAAA